MPASVTSAATRFASATFRASGFSHAMPLSAPLPRAFVSAISSTFATRAKFGPHSHTASIAGSATSWAMDGNAFARPTSSLRASAAVSSACFALGLQTPNTSASRTAWKACRWNRALNPLPMNPTPSRRAVTTSALPPSPAFSPSPASSPVAHPELRERLGRTALPLADERVADVTQVLHARLAREEPRGREIAEAVEEGDTCRVLALRLLGPRDVLQQPGAFGVGAGDERLAVAVVALVIEPGQAAAHRRLQVRIVAEHEVHELRHAGVGGAPRALLLGDDDVHEQAHRLPFAGGEVLRVVGRGALERLAHQRRGFAHRLRCPAERGRERGDGEEVNRVSSLHPSAPFFIWSAMYSLVRSESARIVHVGFLSACDTNGPPSATNRFLQSYAWHQRLSTEVFGSSPMRMPPSSWMMVPPAAMP